MKDNQKKIIRVIITTLIFFIIILGIYFILKAFGITDQDTLHNIINKAGIWGPIVFFLLQVIISTLLSVIPGTNFSFLILAGIIFDNIWIGLILSLLGVWVSSVLMFFVGKTLGEKVAVKLVGEESLSEAQNLIDTKTKVYLPIMFLFPFFPDDALCLAAGLTNLKYREFIPMVIFFRSVGVITTILSSYYHRSLFEILGLKSLSPIGWVMLINLIIFDVYIIYKLTKRWENKINQKKLINEEEKNYPNK